MIGALDLLLVLCSYEDAGEAAQLGYGERVSPGDGGGLGDLDVSPSVEQMAVYVGVGKRAAPVGEEHVHVVAMNEVVERVMAARRGVHGDVRVARCEGRHGCLHLPTLVAVEVSHRERGGPSVCHALRLKPQVLKL